MKWRHKKPKVVKVIRNWLEKGRECWSVPPKDFDKMFGGHFVIKLPDDRICAMTEFGGEPVIIYRGETEK